MTDQIGRAVLTGDLTEIDDGMLTTIIVNMRARLEGFTMFPCDGDRYGVLAHAQTLERNLSVYLAEQHRRTHVPVE